MPSTRGAITTDAGIARGLIYREFFSKEELFVFTVSDCLRELVHELEAARAGVEAPKSSSSESPGHTPVSACATRPSSIALSH